MSNYYNLDGIKTELSKMLSATKTRLAAWEAVTFPTKKDGTPFKVMSKNIAGASYEMQSYAMQPGEYILNVTAWDKLNGYIRSSIDVHVLVKYLKDPAMIAKTQNYQPKQAPYLEQVYTYDIDDIKAAVARKIEQLRQEIIQLEAQQETATAAFNAFRDAYAAALHQLAEDTSKSENPSLFYMIRDTVKERYPFC